MTTRSSAKRISAATIEKLRPAHRRYELTDPAVRGLQLRVEPNGRKTWFFRFKQCGKPTRIKLGLYPSLSLQEARSAALHRRQHIDAGIDPRPDPRPGALQGVAIDRFRVSNLAREFLDRFVRPNRKRPEYVEAILNRDVLPYWEHRDARSISPREIVERLDEIVARGSPVQANRTAAVLSQMFRFGIHRAIVTTSPVQLLYRPGGRERPRERALSSEEISALVRHRVKACRSDHMPHVLMVLLLTLQRRGELAFAKWSDFDFDQGLWTIPDEHSKNGRGHSVPLGPWAIAELTALRRLAHGSRFVLPNAQGTGPADPKLITRSVARCAARFKAFGVQQFTVHDLRRTGRTQLALLRVDDAVAERVLNHVAPRMQRVYNVHTYVDEKRAALLSWESHLREISRLTREGSTSARPDLSRSWQLQNNDTLDGRDQR